LAFFTLSTLSSFSTKIGRLLISYHFVSCRSAVDGAVDGARGRTMAPAHLHLE
jgi:hypothetical protein